jgi:thiamine-phosphate pyrophosphorylase
MGNLTAQLYLAIDAGPTASARLAAVLGIGLPIAAVLIRNSDGALDATSARGLVEVVQAKDIAALVEGNAALARALRADGVHLPWSPRLRATYDEARDILGSRYMVGIGVAATAELARHDAMDLAEAGADYIGFSAADADAAAAQRDLIDWWTEIFQIPCVAFDVAEVEAARALADTRPEFFGITVPMAASPADCAAKVAAIAAAVGMTETAATGP